MSNQIEVVLVYRREDEHTEFIRELLNEMHHNNKDVQFVSEYNVGSSKFLEARTAKSLLSRHATFTTPLILFRKESVVVRALYKEEVNDVSRYDEMLIKKLVEARTAEPVIQDEEEDFFID